MYQNFNTGLKREVKEENAPPGLSYGEVGRSYFDQRPMVRPKLTKPLEKDTDSTMTERDTTQNPQKREIPSNYVKEGPKMSEAQQLPNTDPGQKETSERYNPNWNRYDWEAWGGRIILGHRRHDMVATYQRRRKRKGERRKGGKHLGGGQIS